jgi:adenylate kinase family enzyme
MNNLNNNFLENEDLENDEIYEEIVEEFLEEEQEENEILSEAEKRIEQANLYQALLKHDLFAPGSARQEIIDSVRKEFKTFILSRLETLLGIKQENLKLEAPQVQNIFSDEEVSALKAIASRLAKKESSASPSPIINPIQNQQQPVVHQKPIINTINGNQMPVAEKTTKKIVKKTIIHKKKADDHATDSLRYEHAPVAKKTKKRQTQNISSVTGEDYSQAVVEDNEALRPRGMPSQAEMDAINARQAEMNSRSASPVNGEAGTAGLGAKIAAALMKS